MWNGLQDLALAMEKMVKGKYKEKYHFSSLDPGVDKTKTISKFCQVLLTIPTYREVGVIIFVSRLTQIKSLVKDWELSSEQLAV